MGSGRPAIWKARLGTLRVAPAGEHRLVVFRFPVGISNACAMLQLPSRLDSSAPSVLAASAPRMGNDENRTGGSGGPATSVIAKVKPKTKRPNLYRVLISRNRGVRNIHLRDRRDEGNAGDGFCTQAPASPAMRDGKEVTSHEIRQNRNGFCIKGATGRPACGFLGWVTVPGCSGCGLSVNRWRAGLSPRSDATIYDKGCCCLTGLRRS